jgi:hypothetical protein
VAHVILKNMRRYATRGHVFERGKAQTVSPAVALAIEEDPVQSERFKVHLSLEERNVLATPVELSPLERDTLRQEGTDTDEDEHVLTEAEKLEMVREAIDNLDVDVPSNFTGDGRPDARALTKALGWQVTSAMRDAAIGPHPKDVDPGAGRLEAADTGHTGGRLRITRGHKVTPTPEPVVPVVPAAAEGNGEGADEESESDQSERDAVEV